MTHANPSSRAVRELGRAAGFSLVRIGPATDLHVERTRFLDWIAAGRQGDMRWIDAEHAQRSASPAAALDGASSVISVALSYWAGRRPATDGNTGKIARYAWGADYHLALGGMLEGYARALADYFGGDYRWYVDTGPVMDKALAARSGLGWYGKNTNILTEDFGSFVLLGEIITTMKLRPNAPLAKTCGSCRLCVVACPTHALGPAYTIDSRKCISYLTIEHRGPIPRDLRPLMSDWVFGCDICQDVCPPSVEPHLIGDDERRLWLEEVRDCVQGKKPSSSTLRPNLPGAPTSIGGHPLFASGIRATVDLLWLLRLDHAEYVETFRGTAIRRAKVWMLRRNAAVALGNVGSAEAIGPLVVALRQDEHPIVRGHAAWAIGAIGNRLGCLAARDGLSAAQREERDAGVREEIRLSLSW